MKEPTWVTRETVLAIQEELLARFGGFPGLRDEGLLDSALGRPQQRFAYESPSLFELAAAYTYGIVKNHAFADGNKRVGFMSAYVFLGLNGIELDVGEEEVVLHTLALAAGEESEAEYAAWLRASCGNQKTRPWPA